MTTELVLGPLLRYTGARDATIWVETGGPCEVEVAVESSTHRARTFSVEGHHYALVRIRDLEPGSYYEYSVALDGVQVWPEESYPFPPPAIRTIAPDGKLDLAFGSCRVFAPHEPPYTLKRGLTKGRYERDALYALALRMRREPCETWPDALLLLGDQVYADEVSAGTRDFIRSRRDLDKPPGEEVADFEEYTHLYWDSWKDPAIRWLLSTVPSAMVFDDHDVNDDWNISEAWIAQIRAKPWWEERIVSAFVSYWVYQHLGNLSPEELERDELFGQVQRAQDATHILREFAHRADRETDGTRWSFHRDFGRVRLIVMDSRAGRVLKEQRRSMVDGAEWNWIEEKATGDFDHLLFGTSLPFLLAPGLHHLESWNEAICAGAWGRPATWLGEVIRQALDLEHWGAFHDSFDDLANLLRSVSAGERSPGRPPASVAVLSGDVHHGYLAEVGFGDGAESPVYQATSSPLRNPLGLAERLVMRAGWTKRGERVGKTLARLAGAKQPGIGWRLAHKEPWFENHVSTLQLRGREASLKVEQTTPEDVEEPRLHKILEHRMT
ncbi:MAG: alkaline phosphatase family protein [Rubrobacter sp.]|nr:alkaline phosphatase family protein [Rubrobacter sp.]MDQ3637254.1 alkaline phosphatase family protein [Actinomycetota bacterium]